MAGLAASRWSNHQRGIRSRLLGFPVLSNRGSGLALGEATGVFEMSRWENV